MIEPEAQSGGFEIRCERVEGLPRVVVDALQVQLVLVNLLQNSMEAIGSNAKYERQITVDVRLVTDGEVEVSVTDRGPGVPPDRVVDIFEALYSQTEGGMGMGLAICSAILELHGGRLWYEPSPAGGAIFRFTLPTVGHE
jgi:signal transduction histidine kinase